jgi:hypothetical protein
MKATELRLGNLILHKGQVTEITMARYIGDFNDGKIELNPIHLTEEWLVKFGDYIGYYFSDLGKFEKYDDGWYFINSDDGFVNDKPILYLHTFQNFYFALTGKELTIKE